MAAATARILVADPDRMQLQLIDMLLSPGGFELNTVQSGREALELLKGDSPDLALLALDLPDLPGDEICGKIRRVTRLARMPVILIAPQAGQFGLSDDARARARRSGADLVLPRPLGDKNLRERVRALVDAKAATPHREGYSTRVIEDALEDLSEADGPAGTLGAASDGGDAGDPNGGGARGGHGAPSSAGTHPQAPGGGAPPAGDPNVRDPQPAPSHRPGWTGGGAAGGAGRGEQGPMRHELEALRMENHQLRRKLAEKQAALESGVNPPLQQKIDELERRNRALLEAIEKLKGGRDDERGGGLFGRRK